VRDGDTFSNLYLNNYLGDKLLIDDIISSQFFYIIEIDIYIYQFFYIIENIYIYIYMKKVKN
jgi:hypothetical protein